MTEILSEHAGCLATAETDEAEPLLSAGEAFAGRQVDAALWQQGESSPLTPPRSRIGVLALLTLCGLIAASGLLGHRDASAAAPLKAFVGLSLDKPWPPKCADASLDPAFAKCYQELHWAKTAGFKEHPEWYADAGGLSDTSSDGEWQDYFFRKPTTKPSYNNDKWFCPPFCQMEMPQCEATVDVYSATSGNYVVGPVLDSYTLACGRCTRTGNGRYRVSGCHEYGMECYSTLIHVAPCDHHSQYTVFTGSYSVFADGAAMSCCNAKTGGCGFSCRAAVGRHAGTAPMTSLPTTQKSWPPSCADATVDPAFATCLQHLHWAKTQGIKQNASWYEDSGGLHEHSTNAEWQRYFFNKAATKVSYLDGEWFCPPPCTEDVLPCKVDITFWAAGTVDTTAPSLYSTTITCGKCIRRGNHRYYVGGCQQQGVSCFAEKITVIPCDDQSLKVPHANYTVPGDGRLSSHSQCCDVKTGLCNLMCNAYITNR